MNIVNNSDMISVRFRNIMNQSLKDHATLSPDMRIRVGIDFGTSFTKVAWRLSDETCYPLCFGPNPNRLDDYLIPSLVAFDGDEIFGGFDASRFTNRRTNFKICLGCENSVEATCNTRTCTLSDWGIGSTTELTKENDVNFIAAYYLANVLNLSRDRIKQILHLDGCSTQTRIKWSYGLPVPEKYVDESDVYSAYRQTLETAWCMASVMSEYPEMSDIPALSDCYSTARDFVGECHEQKRNFDCSVYPEVGAEVASIVKSPTSESGLYAFVDVGAGTVDASVFRFFRDDGDPHRPTYAAEIFNLGAAHVEVRANRAAPTVPIEVFKAAKEKTELPAAWLNEKQQKEIKKVLSSVNQQIREEVELRLIEVFRQGYSLEDIADRWRELQLIVGGGGGRLPTYRKAAIKAFTVKGLVPPHKPQLSPLKAPGDFKMQHLSENHFHRFSVAYGLTFRLIELPEVVSPTSVLPLAKPNRKYFSDPTDDG